MKETTRQLLDDFLDCISALKSDHVMTPEFQLKWMTKLKNTTEAIENLDETEFRVIMDQYKIEFKEKFGEDLRKFQNEDTSIIRSTHGVQEER